MVIIQNLLNSIEVLFCGLIKNFQKRASSSVTSYVPNENLVSTSVSTGYPVSNSHFATINNRWRTKVKTNDNKRGTKISISNSKN